MKKDDPLDAALEQPAGYGLLKKLEQRLLLWNYQRWPRLVYYLLLAVTLKNNKETLHIPVKHGLFFL